MTDPYLQSGDRVVARLPAGLGTRAFEGTVLKVSDYRSFIEFKFIASRWVNHDQLQHIGDSNVSSKAAATPRA